MHSPGFIITALDLPKEIGPQSLFAQEYTINGHQRLLDLDAPQYENDQFNAIWYLLTNPTAMQIDMAGRDHSGFSLVLLDCEVVNHRFHEIIVPAAYGTTKKAYGHSLTFKYREHVRFGPNLELHEGANPKVSDTDMMLAKMKVQPLQFS